MIDKILMSLSVMVRDPNWYTPIILIIAGFFTSMTPCSLSSVPLVIGVLTGTGVEDSKRGFKIASVFSLGMVLTFTLLGVISSSLSLLLAQYNNVFNMIVSLILIVMGLQLLMGGDMFASSKMVKSKRTGYSGAFITGILAGLFSSPCATPVLVSLMALSSMATNPLVPIIMFVSFGIGHSIITLIAGASVGKVWEIMESEKYQKISGKINNAFGIIIILLAILLLFI